MYKIALKGDNKTNLYWTINYPKEILNFEIHVSLPKNFWFAIGFSPYGELKLADFCILWTDWKNKIHFQDAWTSEEGRISVDASQDCTNFQFFKTKEGIKFGFRRKFITCDADDYEIEV